MARYTKDNEHWEPAPAQPHTWRYRWFSLFTDGLNGSLMGNGIKREPGTGKVLEHDYTLPKALKDMQADKAAQKAEKSSR